MPQIFHRSTNTFSRVSIFGTVFMVASSVLLLALLVRSSYATGVGTFVAQPVQFSHKHHVFDDGLDCRYCHTTVETSASAGMPSTQICMNCHTQIWASSSALALVRSSFADGQPIPWNRVNSLPDFVYFNHSIHVAKGVGCVSCHGQVDQMPLMAKAQSLQMNFCLDCHRNPAAYVRPRDQVFSMTYQPPADQMALGAKLVKQYDIQVRTDCTVCHR